MIATFLASIALVLFGLKERFAQWLMRDVRLIGAKFGQNTITLSPGGTDVARWSSATVAAAQLDMGMGSDGKLSVHLGGASAEAVPVESEVLLLDGTQAMSAALDMGSSYQIVNLADPTADQAAATKAYVDERIAQQVDVGGAGVGYLGTADETECNALSPNDGDCIVAEAAYTPTATGSDTLAAGDLAEYQGATLGWQIIVANSGGFPPDGTRAIVSTGTALITGGGLTDGTDDGKIAEWDGTTLAQDTLSTPSDGVAAVVKADDSLNENRSFIFDGAVPTGAWVQGGGIGTAHSTLSGLTSGDDHTQYGLLAGRAGGQTMSGGTAAADDLTLQASSHGSPTGAINMSQQVEFAGNMLMTSDADFYPSTGGEGELGTAANKWGYIRGVVVQSGDLHLRSESDDAHWIIRERPDMIEATNEKTGERFRVPLVALD